MEHEPEILEILAQIAGLRREADNLILKSKKILDDSHRLRKMIESERVHRLRTSTDRWSIDYPGQASCDVVRDAQTLQKTLDEEKHANQLLTQISEGTNPAASTVAA